MKMGRFGGFPKQFKKIVFDNKKLFLRTFIFNRTTFTCLRTERTTLKLSPSPGLACACSGADLAV